jgi:hypothetical protein
VVLRRRCRRGRWSGRRCAGGGGGKQGLEGHQPDSQPLVGAKKCEPRAPGRWHRERKLAPFLINKSARLRSG